MPEGSDDRHRLILTGQLGDVMQESVRAALTYARGRCREYGLHPGASSSTTPCTCTSRPGRCPRTAPRPGSR